MYLQADQKSHSEFSNTSMEHILTLRSKIYIFRKKNVVLLDIEKNHE